MTQNNSVKEGLNAVASSSSSSVPAVATKSSFFRKAPKQKSDENEIQVLERFDHPQPPDGHENKQAPNVISCWICAPCIFIRRSTTLHKFALTAATLIVTSLLVISPIIFLISTAPSQSQKDCPSQRAEECTTTPTPPECSTDECKLAALTIQSRINEKYDPCRNFKQYSCSSETAPTLFKYNNKTTLGVRSNQEAVHLEMLQLLTENATEGPFRKLSRLYESCLRQTVQAPTVKLLMEELGGYLGEGTIGPESLTQIISKIAQKGPNPLIGTYFEMSFGKNPHIMLVIDQPTSSAPVLENYFRWKGPKTPPPFKNSKVAVPELLDDLLDVFLPSSLPKDTKGSERNLVANFITELNELRQLYLERDFSNSYVVYNVSSLSITYPFTKFLFQLNWSHLVPGDWSGPIVVRSVEYFSHLPALLERHPKRIIHNSLILLFVLNTLPPSKPTPITCTKSAIWAMPQVSSALYLTQHPANVTRDNINRTRIIFETLKAHLKRAPSLRGAALVKLSSLKIQVSPSPSWYNLTEIGNMLNGVEISTDDWLKNILTIYQLQQVHPYQNISKPHVAWAYPTIATSFYDTLSHSIVVPLSVILVPYFQPKLPPYLHYASVGVQLAKEILRSITKSFEEKTVRCVAGSVAVLSNHSTEILIHSGAMQISYHALMTLSGPSKGMERLSGLSMTPIQIFYAVASQDLCAESQYIGIDTDTEDFNDILTWLVSQGGKAKEVFQCPSGSLINKQRNCNIF